MVWAGVLALACVLALGLGSAGATRSADAAAGPLGAAGSLGPAGDRKKKPSPAQIEAVARHVRLAIRLEEDAVQQYLKGDWMGVFNSMTYAARALHAAVVDAYAGHVFKVALNIADVHDRDTDFVDEFLRDENRGVLNQRESLTDSQRIKNILRRKREVLVELEKLLAEAKGLAPEPPTVTATPAQIKTIPPYLQRALDRALNATGYIENYDASGNAVKAEKSVEQTIDALLEAGIIAEPWDLSGVESNVATALIGTSKALTKLEHDPPDVAAAKRQLQAAVKATRAGIAAVEKLLKPATPKPKPTGGGSFTCSSEGKTQAAGEPPALTIVRFTCREPGRSDPPYVQLVIHLPSAVTSSATWSITARKGSCAVAGAAVTCSFSPAIVGPVQVDLRPGPPFEAPFSVTVTMKDGRTKTCQNTIDASIKSC